MSSRDRLYLLEPEFADAAQPDRADKCKDCATVEGLLSAFPDRASKLDVVHVAYPRPRGTDDAAGDLAAIGDEE